MGAPARIAPVRLQRSLTAAAACVSVTALAACGERTEPTAPAPSEQVNVALAGRPDQSDLCLFQAKETGVFSEAGLDVNITVPRSAAAPFEMLGNERADLIVASPKELLIRRDGGAPYISVARLTLTPINEPEAKPVAPPRGRKGAKRRAPAPVGPEVMVATRTTISGRGAIVRRFVQAVGRSCAGDPASLKPGAKALADSRRTHASVPAADPLGGPPMTTPVRSRPWGWQPPEQWAALLDRLRRSGEVKVPTPSDTSYTNEFLAGEGA
jgi:hypothetical protein